MRDFPQIHWNEIVEHDCRQLVRLAVAEDLSRWQDWTTVSLVPRETPGSAKVVARRSGIAAGVRAAAVVLEEMGCQVVWSPEIDDGDACEAGTVIAEVSGPARDLLTSERIVLNFLGRLSGIATLTSRYTAAVAGTRARIYDTRKTTPGWRRLEKYAVGCGGGHNHRTGLFDAVLIKDNHLAIFQEIGSQAIGGGKNYSPAEAVVAARKFLQEHVDGLPFDDPLIEIEADTLDQLRAVLPAAPDIVLLDNMSPDDLSTAVGIRDSTAAKTELEASGGVTLKTIRAIAETGVDRISVGALTHSATSFDIGLDWND